jgi:type II secretory ATPase GspE/PulE/Tfp pilus assembly ATPase PilB-like protein
MDNEKKPFEQTPASEANDTEARVEKVVETVIKDVLEEGAADVNFWCG